MAGETETANAVPDELDTPPLIDLGLGIGFVALGAVLWCGAQSFPVSIPNTVIGPGLVPSVCGAVFMLGGAALAIRAFINVRAGRKGVEAEDEGPGSLMFSAIVLGGLLFTFLVMPYLGFTLTTGIYAFAVTLAGCTNVMGAALSSALITGATYTLFHILMRVPLPTAGLF